jgi:ferredoxin
MAFKILIEDTHEEYKCRENQSLLLGMEALGKKGIPVGCRGGGCGVCKIEILQGEVIKRPMSRDHISQEEEDRGCVLACRVRPLSDIRLKVVGKMRKSVVGSAVAGEKTNVVGGKT